MAVAHDLTPISPRPGRLAVGNALCVASMLFWAAGFPAAEELLEVWEPLFLITARLLLAVVFLLPVWVMLDGARAVLRANWRRGVFVGSIAFGAGTYLLLLAQWLTDPVTVAIIASAAPVAATLIEVVWDQRRLTRWFLLGLACSVLGGYVATSGNALPGFGMGALAAIGSCFLFAWGSRAAVKDFPTLTPIGRTTITLAGGLVFAAGALLMSVVLGGTEVPKVMPDGPQIQMLLIYALGGMAISQLLWIASVERLGVALAALHINVAPFYVMLIMLAFGAGWNWPQAIGAAIVIAGVILAQGPVTPARDRRRV